MTSNISDFLLVFIVLLVSGGIWRLWSVAEDWWVRRRRPARRPPLTCVRRQARFVDRDDQSPYGGGQSLQ